MAIASAKITINGQDYNMTVKEGENYECTFTSPSASSGMNNNGSGPGVGSACAGKGYYPVTLTITDDAGNVTVVDDTDPTLGESLKLFVKELTKPTCVFTSPSNGSRINSAKPAIRFSATDNGSGIKPNSAKLKIDTGSEQTITMTGTGATLTGSYTPSSALTEGSHTVTLKVSDWDGNDSDTISMTFIIDTVPPSASITSPADGAKLNSLSFDLLFQTNDATSTPVTAVVTVNDVNQENVTVNADGSGIAKCTGKVGLNSVKLVVTDAAGLFTEVTRSIYIDTSAPVAVSVSIEPQIVEGTAVVKISAVLRD